MFSRFQDFIDLARLRQRIFRFYSKLLRLRILLDPPRFKQTSSGNTNSPHPSNTSQYFFKYMFDLIGFAYVVTISGFQRCTNIPPSCFFRFYSKRSRLKIVLVPPKTSFDFGVPGAFRFFKP